MWHLTHAGLPAAAGGGGGDSKGSSSSSASARGSIDGDFDDELVNSEEDIGPPPSHPAVPVPVHTPVQEEEEEEEKSGKHLAESSYSDSVTLHSLPVSPLPPTSGRRETNRRSFGSEHRRKPAKPVSDSPRATETTTTGTAVVSPVRPAAAGAGVEAGAPPVPSLGSFGVMQRMSSASRPVHIAPPPQLHHHHHHHHQQQQQEEEESSSSSSSSSDGEGEEEEGGEFLLDLATGFVVSRADQQQQARNASSTSSRQSGERENKQSSAAADVDLSIYYKAPPLPEQTASAKKPRGENWTKSAAPEAAEEEAILPPPRLRVQRQRPAGSYVADASQAASTSSAAAPASVEPVSPRGIPAGGLSDTPISALTERTGVTQNRSAFDFSRTLAYEESKNQSQLENEFSQLDTSKSTCSVSMIGKIISSADASSHTLFLASMAQGSKDNTAHHSHNPSNKRELLPEDTTPERKIQLPPNVVYKSLDDETNADHKEALLKRKCRREALIAYEASDPECIGSLGRSEFDVFMDAMGFQPLISGASSRHAHSLNERSYVIASELSRLSAEMLATAKPRSPRSPSPRTQPKSSRSSSPFSATSATSASGAMSMGGLSSRTPFSTLGGAAPPSRSHSPSASVGTVGSDGKPKRKPGRMTVMESMVPELYRPRTPSPGTAHHSRSSSPGQGTFTDGDGIVRKVHAKKETSHKRGSFFGLYTKSKEEASPASPGVKSGNNSDDGRSISANIQLDKHGTSGTGGLLASGVTLEGAVWFVQIVNGIDYFEDSKITAVVRDINTHMLMHKRGKATNKYLAANEAAAQEAANRDISGSHRFKAQGATYDLTQHRSFYGLYEEHESQNSNLVQRRRERWDKVMNTELEKYKTVHTFSPKLSQPPAAGVGDAVEVNIADILTSTGGHVNSPHVNAGEDPWKEAIIVGMDSPPSVFDDDSYRSDDLLVSVKLPGSPCVHKLPKQAVRSRWARRRVDEDLESHSPARIGSKKNITYRRADARTTEQRMLEDHCTFNPKSHAEKEITTMLMQSRGRSMKGGRMGAMYSATTGLIPGPPSRLGVPLYYYDAKTPPDFEANVCMQLVAAAPKPIAAASGAGSGGNKSGSSGSSGESEGEEGEQEGGRKDSFPPGVAGSVPLAPALPRWAWMAGGNPANRSSGGGSAKGGHLSGVTPIKKAQAPAKKGVMESVLEEMAKKFAGSGSSSLTTILNKVNDKPAPGKLGTSGKKKKRRGAKNFTEVMDELAYTLAKMRGEVNEEEGGDDESSEEEAEAPKRTPVPRKAAPTPNLTPMTGNSLGGLFGAVDTEEVVENLDAFACVAKADDIPAAPMLPMQWPPVPVTAATMTADQGDAPSGGGGAAAAAESEGNGRARSGSNSSSRDERKRKGSGAGTSGSNSKQATTPAAAAGAGTAAVGDSQPIEESNADGSAAATDANVVLIMRPLPSGYYIEAPDSVTVITNGICSGGFVGSSLMSTLQRQWKASREEYTPSADGVIMPASFYAGVERLRLAAKVREEECERKRKCQLRTYSHVAANINTHTATTVPEVFHFPSEERRENKQHSFRKPVVTVRENPDDEAEEEERRKEAEKVVREDKLGIHGSVRRNMRRGSSLFADSLRSTTSEPAAKPLKPSLSTSSVATNKSSFESSSRMRSARKELFANTSSAVLPATQRRQDRKARAEERENARKEEEKLRKEKLYHQARSTYSSAPRHSHSHEKLLLQYGQEHPELVDETLQAHFQYVTNNHIADISDTMLQQQNRRLNAPTPTTSAAQAKFTVHTQVHAHHSDKSFGSFRSPHTSHVKFEGVTGERSGNSKSNNKSSSRSEQNNNSNAPPVDPFGGPHEDDIVFRWGQ